MWLCDQQTQSLRTTTHQIVRAQKSQVAQAALVQDLHPTQGAHHQTVQVQEVDLQAVRDLN